MADLWLVRHGETDWNRERRLQGHRDIPLNATGLDQAGEVAACLAERFAGRPSPEIYTSDLRRAAQTAQAVGRALERRPRIARKLRERSFGLCEGKTLNELAETHPEQVAAYRRGDKDAIPEVEPYAAFIERTFRALRAIANRSESAVVVTHGGLLKVVLRRVHGPGKQFMIANTALYAFEWDPAWRWGANSAGRPPRQLLDDVASDPLLEPV
ncbi:MAG: histidine phosphatase family protein [Planctomycetes bacterium]|nr:histidine phosphatase family protein [Planctomycetota bacterium]